MSFTPHHPGHVYRPRLWRDSVAKTDQSTFRVFSECVRGLTLCGVTFVLITPTT